MDFLLVNRDPPVNSEFSVIEDIGQIFVNSQSEKVFWETLIIIYLIKFLILMDTTSPDYIFTFSAKFENFFVALRKK